MPFLKWIPTLLLLSVALTACKQESPQPIQLISNANVEKAPSDQDWIFGYYYDLTANPNNYKSTYTTEAASSPSHSLKIQCDTVRNDTTLCYYYQRIDPKSIPTGTKLILKAKIKTANLQGRGVSLGMIGYQAFRNENKIAYFPSTEKTSITGTSDFKEYVVTLDPYPGDIDYLSVFLFYLPNTTGVAYFDDITLTVN